ncbi:hypothetical protein Tco_1298121 [Tanacetum coccineum]
MDNNILQEYKYGASTVCDHKSIPCSRECKIVGKILLDHLLSYALTATADVPAMYLQQFWRTVSKVPGTENTIKFLLDTQQFTFTVGMFRDTLHLPVEPPNTPFVTPTNIHTIKAFMNRVGYQGVVDKVSSFFTKNLAQPWQTMFKVFNRCLTTRTSGHDQTKINILQLFHAVVNQTNVDYAALLWWDFINNVFQKKEAIQYPRFIKLIIADLMKKFPNIPKRLEEDYHSIKDDVPLVSVYTTGNVLVRGMLIPDALLTVEIRETDDFKEYETVFMKEIVDAEKNDVDSEYRLEPESHKDNPEVVDDDDDNAREKRDDTMGRIDGYCALRRMCKRQGYMIQDMERKCVTTENFWETHNIVDQVLIEVIPEIAENPINDLIEYNLKPCIAETIIEDRDAFRSDITAFALRRKFEKPSTSNTSCREDDFHSHHDEHQDDDAPLKGEKRVKRSKKSKRSKSTRGSSLKHSRKDSMVMDIKEKDKKIKAKTTKLSTRTERP